MIARTTAKIVIGEGAGQAEALSADASPIVSARPVLASSEPKMMPVPNSRIVPQSIFGRVAPVAA